MSQLFLWHNLKTAWKMGPNFSLHMIFVFIRNVLAVIIVFLCTSNVSTKESFRYEVDYYVLACTIASGLQVIYFYIQVYNSFCYWL